MEGFQLCRKYNLVLAISQNNTKIFQLTHDGKCSSENLLAVTSDVTFNHHIDEF